MSTYRCTVRCQWRRQLWKIGETVECGGGETPPSAFFEELVPDTPPEAETDIKDDRDVGGESQGEPESVAEEIKVEPVTRSRRNRRKKEDEDDDGPGGGESGADTSGS